MDKVILGLLSIRDLTIYEMRKAVEKSISFFFSASFGTLHPAAKKLAAQGLIAERRENDGDRIRKVYSITPAGREALKIWLAEDIKIGRIQEEGLLKLFFFPHISPQKRLRVLKNHTANIAERLSTLREIESSSRKAKVPPRLEETFNYQMLTADFGIRYLQFELDWYEGVIKKIERGEL